MDKNKINQNNPPSNGQGNINNKGKKK